MIFKKIIISIKGRDMGRHDDLWSLMYVMAEFANSQLPWRRIVDKEKVCDMKRATAIGDLWRLMPAETREFVDYLQMLNFHSMPDYRLIDQAFERGLTELKVGFFPVRCPILCLYGWMFRPGHIASRPFGPGKFRPGKHFIVSLFFRGVR